MARPVTFHADRRATSALEFAILAPLFLFFLLGMIAYGILLGAGHSIQQIAADAARIAVAGVDAGERDALVTAFIDRHAEGYAFVDRSRLAVNIDESAAAEGRIVVAVRYDASHLPVWSLLSSLPLPGKTIERRSTIRIGGV